MKTEAKELIQEGLKLFSLYDRRALKRFSIFQQKRVRQTYHISMKSIRLICVLKQEDCFLIF